MPPFHDELTHLSAVLQIITTEKLNFTDKLKFLFSLICNPAAWKYEFETRISVFQPHGSKKEVRISTPHFLTWQ